MAFEHQMGERFGRYQCEVCGKVESIKEEGWLDSDTGNIVWFGLDGCPCGSPKPRVPFHAVVTMMAEAEVRGLLKEKELERKKLNINLNKIGNKGYKLPYLAVECDLLKLILGERK